MKLGMLLIFVSDLTEAKHFYCNLLGFPLKEERNDRIEFIHEGCDFVAFKCDSNAIVENYSQVARSTFVFEVESIDETFQSLRSKGVRFLHETPNENDRSRYAAFVDPFGNVHEIFERKENR